MNPTLQKHRTALEDAAGTDRFDAAFEELQADRSVKADDMKALALQMTTIKPRSRADALTLLRMEHDIIVGARARARAIGGRTAA